MTYEGWAVTAEGDDRFGYVCEDCLMKLGLAETEPDESDVLAAIEGHVGKVVQVEVISSKGGLIASFSGPLQYSKPDYPLVFPVGDRGSIDLSDVGVSWWPDRPGIELELGADGSVVQIRLLDLDGADY